MTDIHGQLESAADALWHLFNESWMVEPAELARHGFIGIDEDSGSGLRGCISQGQFYGRSDLFLKHSNGAVYLWTVGMLYETGWNGSEFWEQGAGYSYVAVCPKPNIDGGFIPIYSIGDTDFPDSPITEEKWLVYIQEVKQLSVKCLEDVEFCFCENLTEKLYELSLSAPNSQLPNPFRQKGNTT